MCWGVGGVCKPDYLFRLRSGTSVNGPQARNRNRSSQFFQVWTLHERVERDWNGTGTRTGTGVNRALEKMVGQSEGWHQREGTVGWCCVRPCYMEAYVIVHRPHIKVGIRWRRRRRIIVQHNKAMSLKKDYNISWSTSTNNNLYLCTCICNQMFKATAMALLGQ